MGDDTARLEDLYRSRASARWQDRLRRLLLPPAPFVMNPREPRDFPLGRHLDFGHLVEEVGEEGVC